MAADLQITDMTDGLYRRIYAGYITSRKINKLSTSAEAWFWRLHSIADDYGNFNGNPLLVWKAASGLREITVAEAESWTKEVVAAGLAYAYYSDDDAYIHIVGFEVKQPAGKNGKRIQKCPMHPESGCIRVNPGESKIIPNNPGESGCVREILAHHYQDHSHSQEKNQDHLLPTPTASASEVPKPKKPKPEPKPREPNPLWDTLAVRFFPSGVGKSDESALSAACRDLKAKNATPDEIVRRLANFPTVYPRADPPSLPGFVGCWDRLAKTNGAAPTPKPRRNEGIEREEDDHVYNRAMAKWKQENGQ